MTEKEMIEMYGEKEVLKQKVLIQGYVPAILKNGDYLFVNLNHSGLTDDYQKSECFSSNEEAFKIALKFVKCLKDIPRSIPINGLGQLVK